MFILILFVALFVFWVFCYVLQPAIPQGTVGKLGFFAYLRDVWMTLTSSIIVFFDVKYAIDTTSQKPTVGYLVNRRAMILKDPYHIASLFDSITSSNLNNLKPFPEIQARFLDVLGLSLITVDISDWSHMRARTMRFLSGNYLNHYEEIMKEVMRNDILPSWIHHAAGGKALDVYKSMLTFGGKAVIMSFMDVPAEEVPDDIATTLNNLFDVVREATYSILPIPKWVPTPLNRRYAEKMGVMIKTVERYLEKFKKSKSLFGNIIRTHTKRCKVNWEDLHAFIVSQHVEASDEALDKARDYYLAHHKDDLFNLVSQLISLLGAKKSDQLQADIESFLCESGTINRKLVYQETIGDMIGGSESTIVFMTMACYAMAINPDVQSQLRTYLMENKHVTLNDKINNGLLGNVLNETLRVFPPVPVTNRYITEPVTIRNKEGEEITIDPSYVPWMCTIKVHKDPSAWEDPERFNPARWLKPPVPGSFFPFGKGPRICLGINYAKRETAIAVSTMVENFNIALADPNYRVQSDGNLTLRPREPVMLRLSLIS